LQKALVDEKGPRDGACRGLHADLPLLVGGGPYPKPYVAEQVGRINWHRGSGVNADEIADAE
jgi:hypothetical protein